ncbi:nitroreductase family protein [Acidocella facilis]|uniref:nitroreductase family protein n=1 Tax=Acidocella facilis TaxID=525 RepID=UPI001F2FBFFA|nr:nitroreductase family protein [Acidocella facilis]
MSLTANSRTADHPIEPVFLERWSPRAFNGEGISEHDLRTMFEAARWAPSSYNSQPWRFLYARRDNAHWDKFLGLLNPFNQSWAKTGSAIVFIVSSETMMVPGKETPVPSYSHSFDAGAAWACLALQATAMGWFAHGMVGIELEKIYTELKIPAGYKVEMGLVIGKQGPKDQLPEALQAREAPSPRKPVTELAFEGGF